MTGLFQKVRDMSAAFWRETRGAAAAELGLIVTAVTVPLVNITDLGIYAYQKMQLENAAAAGAEAAWSKCHGGTPPAASNCSGLSTAVTAAIQSTSLTTRVTQPSGSPAEGYYCVLTTGALQLVGTAGTVSSPPTKPSPFTCDAVTSHSAASGTPPGDYVKVTANFTYAPMFPGVTVASFLPTNVTRTSWARLN